MITLETSLNGNVTSHAGGQDLATLFLSITASGKIGISSRSKAAEYIVELALTGHTAVTDTKAKGYCWINWDALSIGDRVDIKILEGDHCDPYLFGLDDKSNHRPSHNGFNYPPASGKHISFRILLNDVELCNAGKPEMARLSLDLTIDLTTHQSPKAMLNVLDDLKSFDGKTKFWLENHPLSVNDRLSVVISET